MALHCRQPSASLVRRIRAHLKRGGVIAYATESCYGLGCDPRNFSAVRRLLRIKQRPQGKGLILIAGKYAQIEPYVAQIDGEKRRRLLQAWPGPVTFVVPATRKAPAWLRGRHDTIAVRVTAHPDAAALCNALGIALVSTSANRSGLQPLKTLAACKKVFGARVMAVPGRVGKRKRPSTIVDFASGKVIRK